MSALSHYWSSRRRRAKIGPTCLCGWHIAPQLEDVLVSRDFVILNSEILRSSVALLAFHTFRAEAAWFKGAIWENGVPNVLP